MFTAAQFHQRLSAVCKDNGTSITKFSREVLHISSSVPTNWKNGMSPSAEIAAHCSSHFDISADYLLGLSDVPLPLSAPQPSAEELHMLTALRAAHPSARRAALAAMHAVLASYAQSEDDEPVL